MSLLTKIFTLSLPKGLMTASALFLCLLAACQDPIQDLGRNLPGLGDPLNVQIDSFPVQTSVVQYSSVQSSQRYFSVSGTPALHALLVGRLDDPALGQSVAESYFQMTTLSRNIELSDTAVFDSMVVFLQQRSFYGDTLSPTRPKITLQLHPLTEVPTKGVYYTDDQLAYDGNVVLGQQQALNRSGNLFIRTDALGAEMFAYIRQHPDTLINDAFLNRFKGIAVTAGGNAQSDGLVECSIGRRAAGALAARIFFRRTAADTIGRAIDLISASDSTVFYRYTQQRTGTPLAGLSLQQPISTAQTGSFGFVQGVSNVRTILSFDSLARLKQLAERAVIQRAEIVIRPVQNPTFATYLQPPPLLTLTEVNPTTDTVRYLYNQELAIEHRNAFGALTYQYPYDATNREYRLLLTEFLKRWISLRDDGGNDRFPLGPDLAISVMRPNADRSRGFVPDATNVTRMLFATESNAGNALQLRVYYVPLPAE